MRHFWRLMLLLVGAVALTGADRSAEVEYTDAKPAELVSARYLKGCLEGYHIALRRVAGALTY